MFDSFSIQPALDPDVALAELPVKYSAETDRLQLYPDDSMMTILPSSGDGSVTQKFFHLPEYVCAPVQQGDIVGTVELKLAGNTIGMVNLVAGQDVARSSVLYTIAKIRDFFGSLYLRVVLTLSALTAAVYLGWLALRSWQGRKRPRRIHRH